MLKVASLVNILKISADAKWLHCGKSIHSLLVIHNYFDITLLNSLIHFYVKCDQLHLSRILFDEMPLRNIVSWNAFMVGYLHCGDHLQVLLLFKNLVVVPNSVPPNEYVFTTDLSACSRSGRLLEGIQCHGYFFKFGFVGHPYVKSALVHMYSRCFHFESAFKILDAMLVDHDNDSEIFSYNSTLNATLESGGWGEAVQVLGRMMDKCVAWDSVTYVSIMGLCAQIRDLQLVVRLHARLLRGGLMFDVFVGSMLIDMYGKCGRVLNARKVFDGLKDRNVVVWTALMTAYMQNGYFEESLILFTCMDREDTLPNEYTFAALINACASITALRHGDLLHARVEKLGFKNHTIVRNSKSRLLIHCFSNPSRVTTCHLSSSS